MIKVIPILLLLSGCSITAERVDTIQALCEPNGGLSEIEYHGWGWCKNGALFPASATRVE